MNRRVGYGLAVVASALTVYYAIPPFMAIISLGEICPYSPLGIAMCERSSSAPASSIPSLPPKALELDTAALCTKRGIRYAGATAEGAEVCFTLSPDRKTWLEIGFRFVRASGCRLKTGEDATGRTYLDGPEPLTGRDRLTASGFTARIHGARASGVLEDSTICRDKTFQWSAREVVGGR